MNNLNLIFLEEPNLQSEPARKRSPLTSRKGAGVDYQTTRNQRFSKLKNRTQSLNGQFKIEANTLKIDGELLDTDRPEHEPNKGKIQSFTSEVNGKVVVTNGSLSLTAQTKEIRPLDRIDHALDELDRQLSCDSSGHVHLDIRPEENCSGTHGCKPAFHKVSCPSLNSKWAKYFEKDCSNRHEIRNQLLDGLRFSACAVRLARIMNQGREPTSTINKLRCDCILVLLEHCDLEIFSNDPEMCFYIKNWYDIINKPYSGPVFDEPFTAQDGEENTGILSSLSRIASGFINKFKDSTASLSDVIKDMADRFSQVFWDLMGWFTDSLNGLFSHLKTIIYKFLISIFNPLELLNKHFPISELIPSLASLAIMFIGAVLVTAEIVTLKLIGTIINRAVSLVSNGLSRFFTTHPEVNTEFVAQSADPLATAFAGILLIFGCLSPTNFNFVANRCRQLTSLISAGTFASNIGRLLIMLLPVSISTAVMLKLQGSEGRRAIELEDWNVRATALVRLKSIPDVLKSDIFYTHVDTEIKKGQELLKCKLASPKRALYMNTFVQLLKVSQVMEVLRNSPGSRPFPFAFHVCGEPGVGKSLTLEQTLGDALGFSTRDSYTRSADEFWSGYFGQPIVIYDEFLTGASDHRDKIAREYLQVISSVPFKPPMPDLTNIAVGIKGTVCDPTAVITMNNTLYDSVDRINNSALQRRRKFVVKITVKPEYQVPGSHNVDLGSLSQEQVHNVAWANFSIYPPEYPGRHPVPTIENLSYRDYIDFVKTQYEEYQQVVSRVTEANASTICNPKPAAEIIDEMMRNMHGIPAEKVSLFDSFLSFFQGSDDYEDKTTETEFHAQAGKESKRRRKKNQPKRFGDPALDRAFDEIFGPASPTTSSSTVSTDDASSVSSGDTDYAEVVNQVVSLPAQWMEMEGLIEQALQDTQSTEGRIGGLLEPKKNRSNISDEVNISQNVYSLDHGFMNLDEQPMHRHTCANIYCTATFAHKHDYRLERHPLYCRRCSRYVADETIYPPHWAYPLPVHASDEEKKTYQADLRGVLEDEILFNRNLFVTSFLEKWYSPAMRGILEIGVGVAQGIFLAAVVYGICRLTFGSDKSGDEDLTFTAQAGGERSEPPKKSSKRPNKSRNGWSHGFRAQASTMYPVTISIDGRHVMGIPLKDKYFLTVSHIFRTREGGEVIPGTNMRIEYRGEKYQQTYSSHLVSIQEDIDMAIVTVADPKFPKFPNCMKNFARRSSVNNLMRFQCKLEGDTGPKYSSACFVHNVNYGAPGKLYTLSEALKYTMKTEDGECGAPLWSLSGDSSGRIVGMHVAGSGSKNIGLGTTVSYEDLEEGIACFAASPSAGEDVDGMDEDLDFQVQCNYSSCDELFHSSTLSHGDAQGFNVVPADEVIVGPNFFQSEILPRREQVYLPRHSKLEHSALVTEAGWVPEKEKPILSPKDPRGLRRDPVEVYLEELASIKHKAVDHVVLNSIKDDMFQQYSENIQPILARPLTRAEAIGGVPGKLASLKVSTSSGWPLCNYATQPGKKSFFRFGPTGELKITPEFNQIMDEYEESILDGEPEGHRFLGFLKDEPLKKSKIEKSKTRIIYANDLRALVLFRQYFGGFIAMCNAAHEDTPLSIGINPYSHDMQSVYDYLTEIDGKNFLAGDYKNFDMKQHPCFRETAYELIADLMDDFGFMDEKSRVIWRQLMINETRSPFQIGKYYVLPKGLHNSGGFFTTIVNCLVNEMYIRYCWEMINPGELFDYHVRVKVLGDDHIINVSDAFKNRFDFGLLRKTMESIGQVYTSDQKDDSIEQMDFRNFDECTFLGAWPRIVQGCYAGAIKKEILNETLCWTRDDNQTLLDSAKTMIELASLWPEDYFNSFRARVKEGLQRCNLELKGLPGYLNLQKTVVKRIAGSGPFYAQMAEEPPQLTQFGVVGSKHTPADKIQNRQKMTLESGEGSLKYGAESFVVRSDFTWGTNQDYGERLAAWTLPWDLLNEGDDTNLQNMPFDRFIYWNGETSVRFQVAGQAFLQGALLVAFVPLVKKEDSLKWSTETLLAMQHDWLSPKENTTMTIDVPFKFPRSVLNTYARDTEFLGTLEVRVMLPLKTVETYETTIRVSSAFNNSEFYIPRPPTSSTVAQNIADWSKNGRPQAKPIQTKQTKQRPKLNRWTRKPKDKQIQTIQEELAIADSDPEFHAQMGNSVSNTNTYEVAGNMSSQGAYQSGSATQSIDPSTSATIPMPMDNPILSSGSVPMHSTFSGMSKSNGVEPTVSLQLHPVAMHSVQNSVFLDEETSIQWLCERDSVMTAPGTTTPVFNWSTQDPVGTIIYSFPMNNLLTDVYGDYNPNLSNQIPFCCAPLSQFKFWRADLELEIRMAKTSWQNGRLQWVVSYGAPGEPTPDETTTYISYVMDFAQGVEVQKYLIPFNSATEFLQTWTGPGLFNPIQETSVAWISLVVYNQLVGNDNVADNVDFIVVPKWKNVRVAVPQPNTFLNYDVGDTAAISITESSSTQPIVRAGGTSFSTTVSGAVDIQSWGDFTTVGNPPAWSGSGTRYCDFNFPVGTTRDDGSYVFACYAGNSLHTWSFNDVQYRYATSEDWTLVTANVDTGNNTSPPWGFGWISCLIPYSTTASQVYVRIRGSLNTVTSSSMTISGALLDASGVTDWDKTGISIYSGSSISVSSRVYDVNGTPGDAGGITCQQTYASGQPTQCDLVTGHNIDTLVIISQVGTSSNFPSDIIEQPNMLLANPYRSTLDTYNQYMSLTSDAVRTGLASYNQSNSVFDSQVEMDSSLTWASMQFFSESQLSPEPKFHAQMADEVPDAIEDSRAVTDVSQQDQSVHTKDSLPAPAVTSETAPKVVPVPCRLRTGEKFEYEVANVLEVMRRHTQIPYSADTRSTEALTINDGENSTLYVEHIANRPFHQMAQWYAGWAGCIKYRCFTSDTRTTQCYYTPGVYNDESQGLNFYGGAALFNFAPVYENWSMDGSVNTIETVQNLVPKTQLAIEQLFPVSTNDNFIDVMVPFQNIYHFQENGLRRSTVGAEVTGSNVGVVSFSTYTENKFALIYQALGDDFRLGLFRPPPSVSFQLFSGPTDLAAIPDFMSIGSINIGPSDYSAVTRSVLIKSMFPAIVKG